MNRFFVSISTWWKIGLLVTMVAVACFERSYAFEQTNKIHVKLGQSDRVTQAAAFTVPFQVSGLDSISAEFMTVKLAYDKNKISPQEIRLHENLAANWSLVNRVIRGTGTVDTLWFAMISQHALRADSDVVYIDFAASHVIEITQTLRIVSAAFATRSVTLAAVIESKEASPPIDQTNKVPQEFGLDQNYPNPFNAGTTIEFRLPAHSNVKITVTNLVGQVVANLMNQNLEAGYHKIIWDGKMKSGQDAASGIYICTVHTDHLKLSRKMLLMR